MSLKISCLLIAIGFADALLSDSPKGVVIVKVLNVRSANMLDAKIVTTLPRGSIISIEEKSATAIEIDGIEDHWLKISDTRGKITGWVFGGYIARDFRQIGEAGKYVSWPIGKKGPSGTYRGISLLNLNTGEQKKIIVTGEGVANYAFSADLKYLATEVGQPISGTMNIYEVQSGKLLQGFVANPDGLNWQVNTLSVAHLHCVSVATGRAYLWEIYEFHAGDFKATGKFGKSKNFPNKPTDHCAKYMPQIEKAKISNL